MYTERTTSLKSIHLPNCNLTQKEKVEKGGASIDLAKFRKTGGVLCLADLITESTHFSVF